MNSPGQIVVNYLDALCSGDIEAAQSLVAENFLFTGPFLQVEGKEAFFASAGRLIPIIRAYRILRR